MCSALCTLHSRPACMTLQSLHSHLALSHPGKPGTFDPAQARIASTQHPIWHPWSPSLYRPYSTVHDRVAAVYAHAINTFGAVQHPGASSDTPFVPPPSPLCSLPPSQALWSQTFEGLSCEEGNEENSESRQLILWTMDIGWTEHFPKGPRSLALTEQHLPPALARSLARSCSPCPAA